MCATADIYPLLKRSLLSKTYYSSSFPSSTMANLLGFEISIPAAALRNNTFYLFSVSNKFSPLPSDNFKASRVSSSSTGLGNGRSKAIAFAAETLASNKSPEAVNSVNMEAEDPMEIQVADGYTMSQFCDKIIHIFLNEKPRVKDWKKYLVLRDEWNKYRVSFYKRCKLRADEETDPTMKHKLISMESKVRKIDEEMDRHNNLLTDIQDSPTDINAIVARRRKDFTSEFFSYVNLVSETNDSLEDRDAMARLAARCLSSVSAYDKTLETMDTFDGAQAKFDEILNSPSVEVACEKVRSLAKSKELDSSLILLINSAWAAAKDSKTIKSEAKDIMYQLYKTTKSSLRSIAPREIKLLKHLLNITDPEERFSALATAFCPGDEHQVKDPKALHTTPKELHKWIKIMLDAYDLSKEETDIKEAKQMNQPMVMQRLLILKETIEEEYLDKQPSVTQQTDKDSATEDLL